jgi:hypothetical protein
MMVGLLLRRVFPFAVPEIPASDITPLFSGDCRLPIVAAGRRAATPPANWGKTDGAAWSFGGSLPSKQAGADRVPSVA